MKTNCQLSSSYEKTWLGLMAANDVSFTYNSFKAFGSFQWTNYLTKNIRIFSALITTHKFFLRKKTFYRNTILNELILKNNEIPKDRFL